MKDNEDVANWRLIKRSIDSYKGGKPIPISLVRRLFLLYQNPPNICDLCGGEFYGFGHYVFNENYQLQRGLRQCDKCISTEKPQHD